MIFAWMSLVPDVPDAPHPTPAPDGTPEPVDAEWSVQHVPPAQPGPGTPPPPAPRRGRRRRRRRQRRSGPVAALTRLINRRWFRRFCFVAFVILPLIIVLGWRQIGPVLRNWKALALSARAEQSLKAGRLGEAQTAVLGSIRRSSKRPDSWELLGRVLEQRGEPQSAYAHCRAYDLAPDNERLGVRALQSCLEEGHLDLAEQLAARLSQSFPKSATVAHLGGMLSAITGDLPRALSQLSHASALAPNDASIRLSHAAIQASLGDPAQAAQGAATLRTLMRNPELADNATLSLAAAVASTNRTLAKRILDELPPDRTNDWSGILQRLDLVAETDTAATSTEILRLWPLAPDLPSRVSLLWRCLINVGPESAAALHEKLPPEERDSIQGLLFKTELEARAGHWAEVIRLVTDRVNDLLPPNEALLINLVQLRGHTALGNAPAARQAADRIADLAGADAARNHQVGLILESWDLPAEASAFYETAARNGTGPVRRDALIRLAGIYETARDASRALRTTERLLQDTPDDPVYRNNLAAYLLILDRKDARTLAYSRLAHQAAPASPDFTDTYARALAVSGKTDEALALYESLGPDQRRQPVIAYHHALTLRDAGRLDEARAAAATVDAQSLFPEQRLRLDRLRGIAPAAPATPGPLPAVPPGGR